MQNIYQVPGGSIKVSRVFLGQCEMSEAFEDAVFGSMERGADLTASHASGIMSVQNVCSPAERKENRL